MKNIDSIGIMLGCVNWINWVCAKTFACHAKKKREAKT